jgi:hypothetical protein
LSKFYNSKTVGWRKYVEDEVPDTEPEKESCKDEEESQAEPDSTSEPSTPAPHRSVSITHDVSYSEEAAAENASPDSTTIEEKPEGSSFFSTLSKPFYRTIIPRTAKEKNRRRG